MGAGRLQRIEDYLQRYVDAGRLPGYLVVVTRRGQVAYLASGGHRHIEDGLSVETDTMFGIYSMTKPITSVAAMMLYEAGARAVLGLDSPSDRLARLYLATPDGAMAPGDVLGDAVVATPAFQSGGVG